jgi:hypothetical protein
MASQHFRAGVVIVVRHPSLREVLAFERSDNPGSWQLPQGGLKAGRDPDRGRVARARGGDRPARRHVVVRAEYPEWLAYEWPADVQNEQGGGHHRIGQVQRWFLFDALDPDIVQPTPDGQGVRGMEVGGAAVAHRPCRRVASSAVRTSARHALEPYPATALAPLPSTACPICSAPPPKTACVAGTAGGTAAAAHARRRGRPAPPGRAGQAAAPAGGAGPPDERHLLGAARHRQDHARPRRRRDHQAGVRAAQRRHRRGEGRARDHRARSPPAGRARPRHHLVPRRDPPLLERHSRTRCCRRWRTARSRSSAPPPRTRSSR